MIDPNAVSMELFAAFLDGNLADDDMRRVAAAIDADPDLSHIVGEAMRVDDSVVMMRCQPDGWQHEVPDADFDLPVVPSFAAVDGVVDLAVANPAMADTDVDDAYQLFDHAAALHVAAEPEPHYSDDLPSDLPDETADDAGDMF